MCGRIKATCWMASVLLLALAFGCGEEEEEEKPLSEAIIGTWRRVKSDVTTVGRDLECTARLTLTFYRDGRFRLVTDASLCPEKAAPIAEVKAVTSGRYAVGAFGDSVSFRADESRVDTSPAWAEEMVEPLVGPLVRRLESEALRTAQASVHGEILKLERENWRKI